MRNLQYITSVVFLALSACASPLYPIIPQDTFIDISPLNAEITGQAGDEIYSETINTVEWQLVVESDARVGPYSIAQGAYALSGVGSKGYFFSPGDGCSGGPSVYATWYASAPEYLLVQPTDARLCVVNKYDPARCGEVPSRVIPHVENSNYERRISIVFNGPDQNSESDQPNAQFAIQEAFGEYVSEEIVSVPVGQQFNVERGLFEVVSMQGDTVTLIARRPISLGLPMSLPGLPR